MLWILSHAKYSNACQNKTKSYRNRHSFHKLKLHFDRILELFHNNNHDDLHLLLLQSRSTGCCVNDCNPFRMTLFWQVTIRWWWDVYIIMIRILFFSNHEIRDVVLIIDFSYFHIMVISSISYDVILIMYDMMMIVVSMTTTT